MHSRLFGQLTVLFSDIMHSNKSSSGMGAACLEEESVTAWAEMRKCMPNLNLPARVLERTH